MNAAVLSVRARLGKAVVAPTFCVQALCDTKLCDTKFHDNWVSWKPEVA